MSDNIGFSPSAWDDYMYWTTQDKKTLKRINQLLADIMRNGFSGTGKPEPLKYKDGCWSRRIDDKNRLVYYKKDDTYFILSCRGHYED